MNIANILWNIQQRALMITQAWGKTYLCTYFFLSFIFLTHTHTLTPATCTHFIYSSGTSWALTSFYELSHFLLFFFFTSACLFLELVKLDVSGDYLFSCFTGKNLVGPNILHLPLSLALCCEVVRFVFQIKWVMADLYLVALLVCIVNRCHFKVQLWEWNSVN